MVFSPALIAKPIISSGERERNVTETSPGINCDISLFARQFRRRICGKTVSFRLAFRLLVNCLYPLTTRRVGEEEFSGIRLRPVCAGISPSCTIFSAAFSMGTLGQVSSQRLPFGTRPMDGVLDDAADFFLMISRVGFRGRGGNKRFFRYRVSKCNRNEKTSPPSNQLRKMISSGFAMANGSPYIPRWVFQNNGRCPAQWDGPDCRPRSVPSRQLRARSGNRWCEQLLEDFRQNVPNEGTMTSHALKHPRVDAIDDLVHRLSPWATCPTKSARSV